MFRDPQVNAYVTDGKTIVRFYTEALGFVETFRTPETGRPVHVELRMGGLILGFADTRAAREKHGLEIEPGPSRSEVALWTDGADAAYERLLAAGAAPLSPPHDLSAAFAPPGSPTPREARSRS